MDKNTKSLLKSTLLGLLGGGAVSAAYALHRNKADKAEDAETYDDITVPLSKKNFMKSISKRHQEPEVQNEKIDVAGLTPLELMQLKKGLLRKSATCVSSATIEKTGPVKSVSAVRKSKQSNYGTLRDTNGKYSSEKKLSKIGGVLEDAGGVIGDTAGVLGGGLAGIALVKAVSDKIMIDRKRKQLELSRRRYVDMLNKEVNDTDTPYYTNKKAEDSRGLFGSALGIAGLAGLGTVGVTGLVVYKIMENRRKEEEKKLDKDLSAYPKDKTIKFKFASAVAQDKPTDDFFA